MLNRYWNRSAFFCAVVALLSLLSLADGAAWAHSELLSSQPAPGERLTESPSQITLMFNESLGADSVIVLRDAGLREVQVESFVSGDTLTATVDGLETGVYTVEYLAVSADGHEISGSYTFGVNLIQEQRVPAGLAVGVGIAVSIIGRMGYRRWQQSKNENQE